MKRRILSALLGAVLTFGALALPAAAEETSLSAKQYLAVKLPTLISNVGLNNYHGPNSEWSRPMTSYLTTADDGYMRVQAYDDKKCILVEYYDKNFTLKSSKTVKYELPIFGNFYETEDFYYVLSGQQNLEENDAVEVFRITKYDKNWKRISCAPLYGENTIEPFSFSGRTLGSARMAHEGNVLVIRTCHTMYKSSTDGRNHQANVTIKINTDDMSVIECNSGVESYATGYVSHSFNQFIKFDGEGFVAIDHGDAYPRGVCLFRLSTNPINYSEHVRNWNNYIEELTRHNDPILIWETDSYGNEYIKNYTEIQDEFWKEYRMQAAGVKMLDISGTTGDNETGVSVGGLEASDSSYIVAGTTIDQTKFGSAETRNIFVSVIDKDCTYDSKPTIRKITNYAEGQPSPSNPQLVKINDNKFVLMWTYKSSYADKNKVYLTELNGKGETVGKRYSFTGELSDCQPIVSDGKILWYVCDRNKLSFYSVSTSDLSKNNVTEICTEKPAKVSDYGIEKLRSTSTIKINWKAADRASSYVIKYSTDGRSWKTVTADTNTCTIKKLKAGTKYYIKIAAKNSVGTSDYCKTFTITTKKKK